MTQHELAKKALRIKQASQARQVRPTFTQVQPKGPTAKKRPHQRQHRQQSADDGDGSSDGDDAAVRLISKAQVVDRVGVCFPTIWEWMRQSPPLFPRGRSIGGRTMWIESEVEAWILSQPERSYKKFKAREVA